MSAEVIPKYCNKTGCWNLATVDCVDCKGHPVHGCTKEHAAQLKEYRAKVYSDVARIQAEFRQNWRAYVNVNRFNR